MQRKFKWLIPAFCLCLTFLIIVGGANISEARRALKPSQSPRPIPVPVLTFDAGKIPCIAAHIRTAWQQGKPSLLTYDGGDNPERRARRNAACSAMRESIRKAGLIDMECDEYPPAMSLEGGWNASVRAAPDNEQRSQGGTMGSFVRTNKLKLGDKFQVQVIGQGSCLGN